MSRTTEGRTADGRPMEGKAAAPVEERRHLVFLLSDSYFALDAAPVQEVLPVGALTRVPRMPAWLVGLINLRGDVVPVVDPRPALECHSAPLSSAARVVVVECSRGRVGFLADATEDVQPIAREDIQPLDSASKAAAPCLLGVVVRGGHPVSVIDCEALFGGPAFRT